VVAAARVMRDHRFEAVDRSGDARFGAHRRRDHGLPASGEPA
jgi:hypothetical protein